MEVAQKTIFDSRKLKISVLLVEVRFDARFVAPEHEHTCEDIDSPGFWEFEDKKERNSWWTS